jgi:hypothetical protein
MLTRRGSQASMLRNGAVPASVPATSKLLCRKDWNALCECAICKLRNYGSGRVMCGGIDSPLRNTDLCDYAPRGHQPSHQSCKETFFGSKHHPKWANSNCLLAHSCADPICRQRSPLLLLKHVSLTSIRQYIIFACLFPLRFRTCAPCPGHMRP